jgi:hypothetical protein
MALLDENILMIAVDLVDSGGGPESVANLERRFAPGQRDPGGLTAMADCPGHNAKLTFGCSTCA